MAGGLRLEAFRELWIHTGTTCNLSCPFCHEGSRPGDTRLEAPAPEELAPLLQEAAAQGVQRFAFTGGEPLIHRGILRILQNALSLRPVLVLTNGTAPFIRKPHLLAQLKAQPHALQFRVSIDYADEARHDAGRGLKNFRKALDGLKRLHEAGFEVGITRLADDGEDAASVDAKFGTLLRRHGLPALPIVALPDLGLPAQKSRAAPSLPDGLPPIPPSCTRARMLLRRSQQLRIAPCPLVDDQPEMEWDADLLRALQAEVNPVHRRCRICLTRGVDYAGNSPICATPAMFEP